MISRKTRRGGCPHRPSRAKPGRFSAAGRQSRPSVRWHDHQKPQASCARPPGRGVRAYVVRRRYTAISGVASTRLRVYGCCGCSVICRVSPTSTSFPAIHHRNTSGEIAHHRHGMRDKEIRQAKLALQVRQQIDNLRAHADVERRNRFIGHDEFRTQCQRPRDPDALPLPAAEFMREARQDRRIESDRAQQLGTRARRAVTLIAS